MTVQIEAVEGLLRLRDELTGKLNRAVSRFEQSGKTIEQTGRKISAAGLAMTAGLTVPIALVGGAAVKAFSTFDAAMVKSTAIMGDLSDVMRNDMAAAAKQMARETTFSAAQAAESYFFLASAGLDAKASMAALPTVARFAQAGMFDMALATDLLTDAQSALGMTIRDDAVANMANMAKLSDVLVKANVLANATVQQFSTSLTSEAGAALKTFNIDVEEGVAVLAAFADQGVKAEVAGTGLSRILRLMTSAAVNNKEAYNRMGVAVFDSSGKIRNMADIVADLERAVSDLSDEQRVAALETLGFQARIQGVILPLLGSSEAIRRYEKELRNAGGTTEEVASKQLESLSAKFTLIKNKATLAAISLGEGLAPTLINFMERAVIPAIEGAARIAEMFGRLPGPVQAAAAAILALVAAIGPLLMIVGQVAIGLGALGVTWAGLGAAAVSAITFITGPAGWVAAGAMLLLAWEPVRELLKNLAGAVLGALRDAMAAVVAKVREWWTATEDMRAALGVVARAIMQDLVGALTTAGRWVADVALAVAKAVADFNQWSGILKVLNNALRGLAGALKDVWGWLKKIDGQLGGTGFNRLLVLLRATNPALAELAVRAAAYGAEAASAAGKSRNLVKAASEVESQADDLGDIIAGLEDPFKKAAAAGGGLGEVSEELAKAIAGAREEFTRTVEQNEALVIAAGKGQAAYDALAEEFEIVNALAAAGIDPLSKVGKELIALGKAAEESSVKVRMALRELEHKKIVAELEEQIRLRRELLTLAEGRDVGAMPAVPEIPVPDLTVPVEQLEELNKGAEKWGLTWKQSAVVAEQAWRNIQDAAAGALSQMIRNQKVNWKSLADSILDIFSQMLAKLLIEWAINTAKRIAMERAVAQASGGGSPGGGGGWMSAIGSVFGGGGGNAAAGIYGPTATGGNIAGGSGMGASLAALWPIAAALAVMVALDWYNDKQRDKRFGAPHEFEIRGGEATSMGGKFKALSDEWARIIKGIEDITGGLVQDLPQIGIQVRRDGEQFRVTVAGVLVGVFKDIGEASQAAIITALKDADWGGTISDLMQGVISSFTRDMSAEVMTANLEFARMVEDFGKTDFELAISRIGRQMDAIFQELEEVINTGVAENLAALGEGLSRAVDEELRRWEAGWRQATGIELSPEEQLELMRAQAKVFEAELALRILDLKARRDLLVAERDMTTARVGIGEREIQVEREFLDARADMLGAEITLINGFVTASSTALGIGLTAIDLRIQAINDLIAGLEAIPKIDLSKLRLPGGGAGGGIDQVANDLERLAEMLEQAARMELSEYEQAVLAIHDKWDDAIPLAHGNAEEIRKINEARAREIALLREQALLEFGGDVWDFFAGGSSGSNFVDQVNALGKRFLDLAKRLRELHEEAELTAFELLHFFTLMEAGRKKMEKQLATEGFIGLARGLAELTTNEEHRHALLTQAAEIEFTLRMAQFEMEFEMLKHLGYLTAEQIALIDATLADVARNRAAIIAGMVPTFGGGGAGGPSPQDERAAALRRLRDIQARQLSPFDQAIRSVVDEFAELRRALGWTSEVQTAYADEINRVLMQQLEPIARMQEMLAFDVGSPARSIDQFFMAQDKLLDVVARMRAGDLSALEEIPNLAQLVIDLNPSAQASEATRALFDWVDMILQEAQDAAAAAVNGIVPGAASDPWTWLRDTATAGDQMIAQAVRDVGSLLDDSLQDIEDEVGEGTGGIQERLPDPPFDWSQVGVRWPGGEDPPGGGGGDGPRRTAAEVTHDHETLRLLGSIDSGISIIADNLQTGVRAVQ